MFVPNPVAVAEVVVLGEPRLVPLVAVEEVVAEAPEFVAICPVVLVVLPLVQPALWGRSVTPAPLQICCAKVMAAGNGRHGQHVPMNQTQCGLSLGP